MGAREKLIDKIENNPKSVILPYQNPLKEPYVKMVLKLIKESR